MSVSSSRFSPLLSSSHTQTLHPLLFSVIVPLYHEEGNVLPLVEEIVTSMGRDFADVLGTHSAQETQASPSWELILVDDGSRDRTWQDILHAVELYPHIEIRGVKLRRNYGQSVAMDAGFQQSRGELVFSLDGDRQNDPADMRKLYDKLIADDLDLVTGWRVQRKDPIWMRVITKIARRLRGMFINDGVNDSGCTLRVYRRVVLDQLYLWAEMHRYIIAIAKINGFRIGELPITHRARTVGTTKYTRKKSIKGFIDLLYIRFIHKYSARPLHLFGGVGLVSFFLGMVCVLISGYYKIFQAIPLNRSGFILMGSLLILMGVIFFLFGIMIDLMIRSYFNSSREKRYLIAEMR